MKSFFKNGSELFRKFLKFLEKLQSIDAIKENYIITSRSRRSRIFWEYIMYQIFYIATPPFFDVSHQILLPAALISIGASIYLAVYSLRKDILWDLWFITTFFIYAVEKLAEIIWKLAAAKIPIFGFAYLRSFEKRVRRSV